MALKLSKRHTETSALTIKIITHNFSRTQNFKLGVMGAMQLNDEEKSTGQLTEQTLQDVALNLKSEGYVILHEVMPHSWVTAMRSLFCAELEANYRDPPSQLAGQNGHGGFQPPLKAPFLDPSIIENEIVFQILEYILGRAFFRLLALRLQYLISWQHNAKRPSRLRSSISRIRPDTATIAHSGEYPA